MAVLGRCVLAGEISRSTIDNFLPISTPAFGLQQPTNGATGAPSSGTKKRRADILPPQPYRWKPGTFSDCSLLQVPGALAPDVLFFWVFFVFFVFFFFFFFFF